MKIFYARRKTIRNIVLWILVVGVFIAAISTWAISENGFKNPFSGSDKDSKLVKVSKGLTQYNISVRFNPEEKKAYCQQRTDYINNESEELNELYFHLYPNAFRYEDKPTFPPEELERAYPNGFSPGEITFQNIYVDNQFADFIISGFSDNILKITLKNPLKPGEKIIIDMEYSVTLPNSLGRFGYGENTYNFANWYPVVCVYDDEGWNLDPYYPIGDPFYSDIANYTVNITAPREYIIATTGEVIEEAEQGEEKSWSINAMAVRDFAWIASDKFQISDKKVGDTTVYSYYYTSDGGLEALDYAASSLEIFNRLFGEYPYPQLSVVQSDFFIGGMEYPNLIMIDRTLYGEENRDWLEVVTVHEVAHQWWYGLVGNDQIDEAWLDESLTEYSTILYYGQRYGKEEEQRKYEELITKGKYQLFQIYTVGQNIDETIDRPIYKFDNWLVYDSLVYGKGTMMFNELRKEMGEDVFYKVLQEYFDSNQFKNASLEDLLAVCEKITKNQWDSFFDKWLYD